VSELRDLQSKLIMHMFTADACISVLDIATQHTNKQTNICDWTQAKDIHYLLIY